MKPTVPTPRPAQGFSSTRAQQWVMVSAVLTGLIYTFRRIVEPSTASTTTKSTSKLKTLAGAGTPPTLEHWAISFGTAYLALAVIAMGAPELAATVAMMMVVGNLLTNGLTIASDIAGLENA